MQPFLSSLPCSKATFAYPSQSLRRVSRATIISKFITPPFISLLFPLYLFSFYRATIKRRRMKSWPRAFLSETSSPPSSDRTRKSSSPSVPIFSFSFLFFFPVGEPAVSVADFHGDGGYREEEGRGDIDPRSDFKFFHDERATTNELESCNEAWITRTSGPRSGARMHTRNAPLLRRRFPRPSRERT